MKQIMIENAQGKTVESVRLYRTELLIQYTDGTFSFVNSYEDIEDAIHGQGTKKDAKALTARQIKSLNKKWLKVLNK